MNRSRNAIDKATVFEVSLVDLCNEVSEVLHDQQANNILITVLLHHVVKDEDSSDTDDSGDPEDEILPLLLMKSVRFI